MIRALLFAASLVLTTFSYAASVADVLSQTGQASRELSYTGIVTFEYGASIQSLRVAHGVVDGEEYASMSISEAAFSEFHRRHENAPFYSLENNEFKVPAGWLIEQCGFKGKRFGDAGVHTKQALVLVNYANASGKDIHGLAKKIQTHILNQFNIDLEIEVNVI